MSKKIVEKILKEWDHNDLGNTGSSNYIDMNKMKSAICYDKILPGVNAEFLSNIMTDTEKDFINEYGMLGYVNYCFPNIKYKKELADLLIKQKKRIACKVQKYY